MLLVLASKRWRVNPWKGLLDSYTLERMRAKIFVIAALVGAPLLHLWDLMIRITAVVPHGIDAFENAWRFWWLGTALELGQNPYFCSYLFFPDGHHLGLYNLNLLYAPALLPFFGKAPSLDQAVLVSNVCTALTFYFSMFCSYWMLRQVRLNQAAAVIGAFMISFASHRILELASLNLESTFWISLLVGSAINRSSKPLVVLGRVGIVAGAFFSSLTVLMIVQGLGLAFAIESAVRGKMTYAIRGWIVPLLIGCLLPLPVLLDMTLHEAGDLMFESPLKASARMSAAPGELLRPTSTSWLGKALPSIAIHRLSRPHRTHLSWLSIALALPGIFIVMRRRQYRFLIVLMISFFVLALGPRVEVASHQIPLPYAMIQLLGEPFTFFRTPYRFIYVVTTLMGLFAAVSLDWLFNKLSGRTSLRAAVACLIGMLTFAFQHEQLQLGTFEHVRNQNEWIAQHTPKERGTLFLPSRQHSIRTAQRPFQIVSGSPLTGTVIPRIRMNSARTYQESKLLQRLIDDQDSLLNEHKLSELRAFGVGAICTTTQYLHGRPGLVALLKAAQVEIVEQSGRVVVVLAS